MSSSQSTGRSDMLVFYREPHAPGTSIQLVTGMGAIPKSRAVRLR